MELDGDRGSLIMPPVPNTSSSVDQIHTSNMHEPGQRKQRRTQQERSEATRKLLLKAAISVLVSRGYSKFTTAEVARVAGTSRGAQTHHFPSTQAFILAAIDYLYAGILKRTQARVQALGDSGDLLDPIVRDGKDFLFGTEFLSIYNTLVEMRNDGAETELDEIGIKYRVPIERIWAEYLQRRGVEAECAENVVWTVFSVLRGLTIRRILAHDPEQVDRTLEFTLEAIRKNLRYSN